MRFISSFNNRIRI